MSKYKDVARQTIYVVHDLLSARRELANIDCDLIITNPPSSTYYYGILVLDYMFQTLMVEFPQITDILLDVDDNHAALFTAMKLGYKNINYSGSSREAQQLLLKYKSR